MIADPRFFKLIAKISPMVFSAFDEVKGKLIYFNELAQRLLGLSEKELNSLSGDGIRDLVHPEDRSILEAADQILLGSDSDHLVQSTVRMRNSKGQYLWIHSRRMVYERDANNRPTKFAGVHQEITELKELEIELQKTVKQLQEISHRNSHELRSPVSSILGLLDLIDEKGFSSEFDKQVLAHLRNTVVKLDRVIHEISESAKK